MKFGTYPQTETPRTRHVEQAAWRFGVPRLRGPRGNLRC